MESTLSGLLPVAALHDIQMFCWRCGYSCIKYFRQNRTSFFFFRSTHVYRSKHAPKVLYDLSPCEFALGFRAASKMNLSVTKLWSTGASSGELNKKWLSFSQASTAIFPFHISGNRGTWTITKDVLCGEFQRHVGRRQRK